MPAIVLPVRGVGERSPPVLNVVAGVAGSSHSYKARAPQSSPPSSREGACATDYRGTAAQGAVTHDQLDYYLDEFTFRFNRRRSRHRGPLFYRLLEGALAAQPAPYKTLISQRALLAGDSPANPG